MATLKSNNARLTSALQESTANVDEWKRQLAGLKEENMRMKAKYQADLENSKGRRYASITVNYLSVKMKSPPLIILVRRGWGYSRRIATGDQIAAHQNGTNGKRARSEK